MTAAHDRTTPLSFEALNAAAGPDLPTIAELEARDRDREITMAALRRYAARLDAEGKPTLRPRPPWLLDAPRQWLRGAERAAIDAALNALRDDARADARNETCNEARSRNERVRR